MMNNILNMPVDLLETIFTGFDMEDIKNISVVCKALNSFINTNKFIHANKVYNTKCLSVGNVNNSWKSMVSTLCIKNIFNSRYVHISFNFETCIKKLELTKIYIDELDITNCVELEKLIVKESIVKYLVGVDTAKKLIKLDVSMSTVDNIKISPYLKNLNLNYTILKSISIPAKNSLVKFQSKNCNFKLSEGAESSIVNQFNCLPLMYSKLTVFSIKSKYMWDRVETNVFDCITSICVDTPSVKNLHFLKGCNKNLKKLEISNSRIENMEKIREHVYSVRHLHLRENRINNFDFIKQYVGIVRLEIVETSTIYQSEFVHELENLKQLHISGNIHFDIKNINEKAPLESLYLDVSVLENIKLISEFHTHLTKLYISAYTIDVRNKVIDPISKCTNLIKLKINYKGFSCFGDKLDVLRPLVQLDKLLVLDINGVFLTLKQLDVINEVPNLKFVNLPIKFYHKFNLIGKALLRKTQYSFKNNWTGFSKKNIIFYRGECNEIKLLLA